MIEVPQNELDEIYNEGEEAGLCGHEDCPFEDNTHRALAWMQGHRNALLRRIKNLNKDIDTAVDKLFGGT